MATAPDPSPPTRDLPDLVDLAGLVADAPEAAARPRSRQAHSPPGPVAFVLSGGGNLGALQVGMLRALLEHGVRPDLVVGCSVGAINGAGFADVPTLDGVDALERVWLNLEGQDLLPSGWSNAVSLARRGEAIHDHANLRRMARQVLRATSFEELALRFECVATDVAGAREVWFDTGPLIEPILASSALPAIYPAVEIDGVRYLDGGIVNDVPMSRAVELGARTVYILQVGSFTRPRREPRRPLDVAVQAYWVARHHRFKRELGALPPDVAVHVLPTGETPRMRFNDFTQSAILIARAYEAATAYLDDLEAGHPPRLPVDRLAATTATAAPAAGSSLVDGSESEPGPGPDGRPGAVAAAAGALGSPAGSDGRPGAAAAAAGALGSYAGWGGDGTAGTAPAAARAPATHPGAEAGADGATGTGAGGGGGRVAVRANALRFAARLGGVANGNGRAAGNGGAVRAEWLPGVRRWARTTRLGRIGERPRRRTPAAVRNQSAGGRTPAGLPDARRGLPRGLGARSPVRRAGRQTG